jgi:hypothetical protein
MTPPRIKKLKKYILTFILIYAILFPFLYADFSFSESQDLEIIAYRGLNFEDYYMVFGEIYNGKRNSVTNVKIEFDLLSSNGNLIDRINATSTLKVIPPKRRAPFIGYSFKSESERNTIKNVTIDGVYYDDTEEKPQALTFVYYRYENGTFTTHIYNNCTLALGVRKATNRFVVSASLYHGTKIVGVWGEPLVLADPAGLLWDEDTSSERFRGMPPVTIKFAAVFPKDEVMEADKLIASVESRDFSGQYVLIGLKDGNEWTWTTIREEENPLVTAKDRGNNYLASLTTLLSLVIVSISIGIIIRKRKHK